MTSLHFVSDLHADIERNEMQPLPDTGADLIVVAGDVRAPGTESLKQLRSMFENKTAQIIYVAGNHDFYSEGNPKKLRHYPELKTTFERQLADMPAVAASEGIILLSDTEAVVAGVRFLGATLWTDQSARPGWMTMNDALRSAARMNDYRLIKREPGRSKDVLRPIDTVHAHRRSVEFIERALTRDFEGDTVLVTHHPATPHSLLNWSPDHPERFGDLDWCYASNSGLERWFTGTGMPDGYVPPVLALHGHVHVNRDYRIGGTRVVANPRGYPSMGRRENPDFDPALVLKIEPRFIHSLGF
jgi:predicted phosphodiesterase